MSGDEPARQGTQEPSYRRDGSGSLCWHLSCLCAVGRGARGLRSGCILRLFPLDSAGRTWICRKQWTLCLQLKCLQPSSGCPGSNADPRSGWGTAVLLGSGLTQMSSQQNAKALSHPPCPPARGGQPESEPLCRVTGALKSHSGDTHGSFPCAAKGGTECVTGEKHCLVDTQCGCAGVKCGPVSLHGGWTHPNMGGAECGEGRVPRPGWLWGLHVGRRGLSDPWWERCFADCG